jgi:hypothetical protein
MPETGLALPIDEAQWLTAFMRPRGFRLDPSAITT